MFESAEIGHKIDKQTYLAALPELREALVEAQYDLREGSRFPLIIVIAGLEASGRGEVINLLNEWMDPRHIQVHTSREPMEQEPAMWRFWLDLPPKGRIGIFFGSWYTSPIRNRVAKRIEAANWDRAIERISRFEKMLTDEGCILLKFWLHLSRDAMEARLKKLSSNKSTKWKVTKDDWQALKTYDRFRNSAELIISETSTAHAPWIIVEATQHRYRELTIGRNVLKTLQERLAQPDREPTVTAPPLQPPIDELNILDTLDLSQSLERANYKRQLKKYQGRLSALTRDPRFQKLSMVAVFEGFDAAGKGGAIRRVTRAMDVRILKIHPVSAPTDEELAQPYLWRFWRRIPRRGRLAIFDRSWYGRVLVERVENLCSLGDWMRAYSEINEFEQELTESGVIVVKFWLSITKEEQLRRFREREHVRFKRFKITEEDWRNREKWDDYARAVGDMIDRTSTVDAPWTLVEANNKYFARVKVLKTFCARLKKAYERLDR